MKSRRLLDYYNMNEKGVNEKFCFVNHQDINPILYIFSCGIVYPDKNYFSNKSMVSDYLFEYIVHGKGHLISSEKKYVLNEGDFCIIRNTQKKITYYADENFPYKKLWFGVSGKLVDNLMETYGFSDDVILKKFDNLFAFEKIFSVLESSGHDAKRLSSLIHELLLSVYYDRNEEGFLHQRIKDYIDEHIFYDCKIEDIALNFSVSKRHLARLFKNNYNQTVTEYINDKKLIIARRLLLEEDFKISEIAEHLNFCDQSYFSNKFKKKFGVYPTEYRKNQSNETFDDLVYKN